MKKLQNGERIKITWLPSCKNAPTTPNPYIGMEGTVEDLNDHGFVLDTGQSVLVVNNLKKLKFEEIP